MEAFFNELSINPRDDAREARRRVIALLEVMRELRSSGFNVLRTGEAFFSENISVDGYTFSSFLSESETTEEQRIFLHSIHAYPYISAENEGVADQFIMGRFTSTDIGGNLTDPEGLASAYLLDSATVSLDSHSFWRQPFLGLTIELEEDNEAKIVNFANRESFSAPYILNWLAGLKEEILLNSKDNIERFFGERFEFETRAIDDLIKWYYNDARFLRKIKQLILDTLDHPHSGGLGLTEILRHGGRSSKRINGKDRLVYTYSDSGVQIHQCWGHYEDH